MADLLRTIWTYKHSLPVLIVALYVCTATRYGFAGDWGRVMYWVCAAGITVAATWLVRY